MKKEKIIEAANKRIGDGQPIFVIAELGINHNGSMEIAKKMIDGAIFAGADAVKFQKRTPELCVPQDQWAIERETPWGRMSYLEYRHAIEFTREQYSEINTYCKEKGIIWFASCWDVDSVDFIEDFNPPIYKASSASLTDKELIIKMKQTGKPLIISTGMSTMEEIEKAVNILGKDNLLIAHSTSTYPCKEEELNLNMIKTLKNKYPNNPIGYSGHEVGLSPTWAAVAMGATFVERHITLERAMWGTDQPASVEIMGFYRLVSNIRDIQRSLGDGIKKVYESEISSLRKLRKFHNLNKVESAA